MSSLHQTDRTAEARPVPPPEKRTHRLCLYFELLLTDCIVIFIGFYVAGAVLGDSVHLSSTKLSAMIIPPYLGYAAHNGVYGNSILSMPRENAAKSCRALLYSVAALVLFLFLIKESAKVTLTQLVVGTVLSGMLIVATRVSFRHYANRRLRGSPANTLLIIDDVAIVCADTSYCVATGPIGFEPDLGNPEMLRKLGLLVQGFERVVVSCSVERRTRWTMLLRGANINGEIIASEFAASGVLGVSVFCGHNTHQVSRGPLCTVNRAKKRILDLSLTVPILILLAPLLIIVALAIKVESTGPVLFQQNRMGRGNRVFKIMKFRSMRTDMSDSSGERSASRDDDRVTRVGRLIRATSIDELPQLINVLLGDMSLVGPRPHALGSRAGNQLFWEIDEKYWIRHCLKPGITGLAQVRGYRGATDVPDDLINRLGADLEYIDSWTLSREIVILLRTLKVIVHRNAF
ncbi:hypothetical protein SPH9361_04120 [Sphingobium sp. CECT 9361]|nr:hypothetical protein SPH9361_04120 [Sphingobium sp. CECT 9361]